VWGGVGQYFYLKEVFGGPVNLLEALLACIGHCLHLGDSVCCALRFRYGAQWKPVRPVSSWNGKYPYARPASARDECWQ